MYLELDAYIDACRARPFAWLDHDCAHFAAGWVREATGRDPLADLADLPRSLRAHVRLIHAAGGMRAMADARLGRPIPGRLAQRGDIVLVLGTRKRSGAPRESFGVCTGSHVAAPGPTGIVFVDANAWEAAWRLA